jgi:hypothetical protein
MRAASRRLALIILAVLATACDPGRPAGSGTPPPVFSPSPPPETPTLLKGVVLDGDNLPVAGASVALSDLEERQAATTDPEGRFEFTTRSWRGAGPIVVETPGYEPTYSLLHLDRDNIVRHYRVRRLAAGASATLGILDGAYCGASEEFTCRRIRIVSPVAGRLTVEVASDGGPDQVWLVQG